MFCDADAGALKERNVTNVAHRLNHENHVCKRTAAMVDTAGVTQLGERVFAASQNPTSEKAAKADRYWSVKCLAWVLETKPSARRQRHLCKVWVVAKLCTSVDNTDLYVQSHLFRRSWSRT